MDIFITIALMLLVSKTFGFLFTKLKQPSALGEIIGGIVIGPSLLSLVEFNEAIELVSSLGVVLLLFLAGLETDLDEFKRVGVPAFLIAGGGVIVPFILGYWIAIAFGYPKTQALFLGGVLTATSVGLTASILMEMKKLRGKEGTAILAAAVVDDVLAILLLTVFVALNRTGSISIREIATLFIEVISFFVFSIFIGVPLVKRLMKLSNRINVVLPEAVPSFAFAIVLIFAYLAEEVRIAAITGAFLAGLILGQTDEARRISDKMITIAYSLFIPVFLVGIGVNSDIRIFSHAGKFAIIYSMIAIIGKIVGCGAGAMLSRFNLKEALRVGIGMIPRMEVALIMANIALTEGVFDRGVFSVSVAMVIVTTILTPPLLKWAFSRE
jgi:Kef-type K+ transport system membrane component KefB